MPRKTSKTTPTSAERRVPLPHATQQGIVEEISDRLVALDLRHLMFVQTAINAHTLFALSGNRRGWLAGRRAQLALAPLPEEKGGAR